MDCTRFVSVSIWFLACSGVVTAGCKDEGSGDAESDSSGESGAQESSSDGAGPSSSSADGSSSAGADSSTGEALVVLSGEVQDLIAGPIPDAMISLLDMPGFETTSDAEGNYALLPLPAATEITVIVDPSTEYLGSVIPLTVPDTDFDGQLLAQISLATVQAQIDGLAAQMPQPADLDQSIVIVRLVQKDAAADGGATIDMQPPPVPGTFYAPDPTGQQTLDLNVIGWTVLPVMVYFNVPPSDAGVITITATHPLRTCTIAHPSFPTLGGHVTLVDVDCPS